MKKKLFNNHHLAYIQFLKECEMRVTLQVKPYGLDQSRFARSWGRAERLSYRIIPCGIGQVTNSGQMSSVHPMLPPAQFHLSGRPDSHQDLWICSSAFVYLCSGKSVFVYQCHQDGRGLWRDRRQRQQAGGQAGQVIYCIGTYSCFFSYELLSCIGLVIYEYQEEFKYCRSISRISATLLKKLV